MDDPYAALIPAADSADPYTELIPKQKGPANAKEALAAVFARNQEALAPTAPITVMARGFAQGVGPGLAGIPMNAIANIWDLARAGVGSAGNALGLIPASRMPGLIPREQLGGTTENISALLGRAGVDFSNPNPNDPTSRLLYAGAQTGGGAMLGGPKLSSALLGWVPGFAGQMAAEQGLPPSAQILASLAVPAGMQTVGQAGAARQQQIARTNADMAERVRIANEFMARGGKLAPAEVNPSLVNKFLQGALAGTQETQADISIANRSPVNALARRDIGLAPTTPLTRADIDNTPAVLAAKDVKAQIGQQGPMTLDLTQMDLGDAARRYQSTLATGPKARNATIDGLINEFTPKPAPAISPAVARLNPQLAAQMQGQTGARTASYEAWVNRAQALRDEGFANLQSEKGKTQQLGKVQLEISAAIEDQIKANLKAQGRGDLASTFDSARTTIAKANDVKESLDAGQVNAGVLGKKNADNPNVLTGGLRAIAEAQGAFPQNLQNLERSQSGFRLRDPRMLAYGLMAGGGLGGAAYTGSLYPLAVASIPVLGYGARQFLTSGLGQRMMARPAVPYGPVSRLARELARPDYSTLLGSYLVE